MNRSTIRSVSSLRSLWSVAKRFSPLALLVLITAFLAVKPAGAQVFQTAPFERHGRNVKVMICNGNPLCTKPVLVGIATYCDPDVSFDAHGVPLPPTWSQLVKQTLYDYKQAWVKPGCCVTLKVKSPKCTSANTSRWTASPAA